MNDPIRLAYRFTKGSGQIFRVTSVITREMSDQPADSNRQEIRTETLLTLKTLEFEPDGSTHLLARLHPLSRRVNNIPDAISTSPQLVYMRMAPEGKILEVAGLSVLPTPLIFPSQPVAVGDEWSDESTTPLPGTERPVRVVNRFRLEEVTQLDGVSCARIGIVTDETALEFVVPGPTGSQTAQGAGTAGERVQQMVSSRGEAFFNLEEGSLIRQSATIYAVAKQRAQVISLTNRTLLERTTEKPPFPSQGQGASSASKTTARG